MRQIVCYVAGVLLLACLVQAASVAQDEAAEQLLAVDAGVAAVDANSPRIVRQFGFGRPYYGGFGGFGGGYYGPRPGFYGPPRPFYGGYRPYPRPYYGRPYYG